jgi:hypothetical protein
MSIERSNIKYYKSLVYDDGVGSGGRRSNTQITSGSSNQLFPVITSAERSAGSIKFRKIFVQVETYQNLPLIDAKVYIESPTQAQDMVFFAPGTATNIKSGLTGSERFYGCGYLNANVALDATVLTVRVEDGTIPLFVSGDLVRISNKSNLDDTTSGTTEEYVTITGTPSVVGSVVTFSLVTGVTNAYLAADTRVASVYQAGNVDTRYSDLLVSSTDGLYDEVNYPIELASISTITQNWTLTFTTANLVTVVGDSIGSLGSFLTLSGISPVNVAYSSAYFTLPAAAFSGTFVANDVITFKTYAQFIPLWFKRIVPIGTATFTGNKFVVVVEGESE